MQANINKYSWAVKIFAGLGIIGALYYFTPLLDILYVAIAVTVVPITALFALGLISEGSYRGIKQVPDFFAKMSADIKKHTEEIRAKAAQNAELDKDLEVAA